MAIYHARLKTFSRSKGQSAIAAAAYRAGMLLTDPVTGRRHNYRFRGGVVETRCIAPHDAPAWAFQPEALWAAAEAAERRKDATVAREFEIALPHEVSDEQRLRLAMDLANALVDRYRFAIQVSLHAPDAPGSSNHHAHMLATTRRIGPEGLTEKTRELDGGPAGRAEVEWTRRMVADVTNRHLAEAAVESRVDHRTLEAQAAEAEAHGDFEKAARLTREPTVHLGQHAAALERKGERTRPGLINASIGQTPPQAADKLSHPDEIRVQRHRAAPASAPAETNLSTPLGRLRAAREAYIEARRLWDAHIDVPRDVVFAYTPRILRFHATRIKVHTNTPSFAVYVRELLRKVQQLIHDAGRFLRRRAAEAQAQARLIAARQSLEAFDEQHPKPGVWARSEWTQRRNRRLAAVANRLKAWKQAHGDISDEAQHRYTEQVRQTAKALEAWSAEMLERYPIDADEPAVIRFPPREEAQPPAAASQERGTRTGSGKRIGRPKF